MGSIKSFEKSKQGERTPGKINASLNEKLRNVEWGEFKLGELFEIENTLSFNTDRLVPGNDYDYITRTSSDQGILQTTGFVNKENINAPGTWSLGLLQMDFFYREKPWYAGQFIKKIIPKIKIREDAIPFFSTILNKLKPQLLSVLVRDVDNVFKSAKVKIPVQNRNIDFDFMASFVTQLKAQHIDQLETYLTVTGMKDTNLTTEEDQALLNFEKIQWAEFNLEKLFGKSTRGRRLKSSDRIKGSLPFVTAGEANEGVSDLIGNNVRIFSANTTTIDMFGSAKYRNYRYGGDDHIAVVHTESLHKNSAIFVTSAIHKSSHNGQFDYGKNFYAKDADELNIMLPVVCGKPDYETMNSLISAIHKLVIKDVVNYTDMQINTTYNN